MDVYVFYFCVILLRAEKIGSMMNAKWVIFDMCKSVKHKFMYSIHKYRDGVEKTHIIIVYPRECVCIELCNFKITIINGYPVVCR